MNQPYTWVKRANKYQRREMQEVVDSMNELAHEDYDTHGYILENKLERCGDGWGIVQYYKVVHPEVADLYQVGQEFTRIALVRCSTCGEIRELSEGQIEFCYHCDTDWDK